MEGYPRQLDPSRVTSDYSQAQYLNANAGRGGLALPTQSGQGQSVRMSASPTARTAAGAPNKPNFYTGAPPPPVAGKVDVALSESRVLEEAVRTLQGQVQALLSERQKPEGAPVVEGPRIPSALEAADMKTWRTSAETQLAAQEQHILKAQADLKAWRSTVETQMATQDLQLQKAQSKLAGFEQKLAAQPVADQQGSKPAGAGQSDIINVLQTQVAQLLEEGVEKARQHSVATADRVNMDMELKDLRIQFDTQTKQHAQQLAAQDALLKEMKDMVSERQDPKLASIEEDLKLVRDVVKTQDPKLATVEQDLRLVSELVKAQDTKRLAVDEDLKLLRDAVQARESAHVALDIQVKSMQQQRETSDTQIDELLQVQKERCSKLQNQHEQQADILQALQTELLSLQQEQTQGLASAQQVAQGIANTCGSAVESLQEQLQSLQSGINKQYAELADMHDALSKDVDGCKGQLANINTAVKTETAEAIRQVKNELTEAQQVEFKDTRRFMDVKLDQQEQIMKALRGQVNATDEKMEQLMSQSRNQADKNVILDDLDALKKELLAQRSMQSSELQREADALHSHVHQAVSAEREARQTEDTKHEAMFANLRSEIGKLSDDNRMAARSMPTKPLTSELPPLECINTKTQLDATHYIGPAKK